METCSPNSHVGAEQGDRQGVRGRGWPGWSWVRKGRGVGSGAEVRESRMHRTF